MCIASVGGERKQVVAESRGQGERVTFHALRLPSPSPLPVGAKQHSEAAPFRLLVLSLGVPIRP